MIFFRKIKIFIEVAPNKKDDTFQVHNKKDGASQVPRKYTKVIRGRKR